MKNLENKKGIIFGATGFLGSNLSIELTKLGAKLILHGKSKDKLYDLEKKITYLGTNQTFLQADITKPGFYENLLQTVSTRFDSLDFLINVLGKFNGLLPLTHLSEKDWNELIEINITSYWHCLKELEPLLKMSMNPKVIFLTNKNISNGKPYHNIFSICKAAINSMSKVYSEENKKLKIKVHLIDIKSMNIGMTSKISSKKSINKKEIKKITENVIKNIV